jgi:flagellum-specific peptidoglycan hydrolase FlgJ
MAMSNGASASEVGGDLIKESYRATPGIGQAVDVYDAYNDYNNPEEGEEKPGLFNNMWNGTKDALGLNSADGVADFAKDTALTTGAMAATTGAIGGLLSGGGVAAGALAALGGPVTLGIILGGAAIYGGIKLYQAMSKGDTPLLSFRLAQYGYKDSSKSEIKLILKLESELAKITRVQGDTVTFTKADEAVGIAIKSLGINTESAVQMKSFTEWFGGRFKPVYFAWVAAVNNVKKGMSLDKVDDSLKPQEKLDLMASVHSEAKSLGAYKVSISFNAEKALLNTDTVEKVYKSSQNGIEAPQDRATKEKAEATKQEVESQKSSYWEKTKNMFSSAAEGVSNLWDKTKAAGSSFVSGVKDGINSVGTSISNGITNLGNAAAGVFEQVKAMSGTNKEKYNKIRSAAVNAGDPHPDVVAAQWALESGWGKKQSGKNNYFGIKAGKGEAGTAVRTREVLKGQNVMITDKFKDYNSLEEGIADRVAFIKRNPRYTKAGYFVATTPFQAATALQRGGYATDPNYATLLGKIIKGCGYDPSATSAANTSKAPGASASKPPEAAKKVVAPLNSTGVPVTLAKPGTNTPGLSLDPSKKPNIAGMAMPGAAKAGTSGAGMLADPKKVATVGNTMGTNNGGKYANNKAIKAAKLATEKAAGKSLGYCAKYVANALQGAGFKFTRQNSAFQYHTNGIMTGMGFVAINSTSYQIGDVVVWAAHGGAGGGGVHGHIQIFNGKNWVSDFIQRSFVPGKSYGGGKSTLYRDKELVGANVEMAIDSKTPASDMTNDTNGVDSASPGAAALNTKYSGMTVGDVIRKRKEAKTKVYGADGTATDYDPGSAGSTKVLKADVPTAKTTTTTNPNNTSMKATTIPTGVATGTVLGATVGGKTVDEKKDVLVQQEAAKKAVASQSNTTNTAAQSQAAMRDAKMSNSTSSVGNTSANFPAESIRLFTSMDSKLSQVVTALNKLAVINQDGIKVQTDASNRQAIAMNETAKAMTTVATAAITNKGDAKSQDGKTANAIKPGVIGAGKPQPVSVLS